MIIDWTDDALKDVERLVAFLLPVAPAAAARVGERLLAAPYKLIDHPRIGAPLSGYAPLEVRRLIVGDYELRYQLLSDVIRVVNIWHTRENRPAGPES